MHLARLSIKLPEVEIGKYWRGCVDSPDRQPAGDPGPLWERAAKKEIVLKRSSFEASNEFREGRELIGDHLPGQVVLQFQRMRIKFGLG